ncbi:hypothetical protein [Actinotalea sp. K2]|uniref:hypothetical protein n=1 Tax=Actinotalea sp. K2 TaxID=2939438 RepID=UPI002017C46A|nr:hypothetical protein [Actinotalea sp. K2]MCL3860059.1 hypothetical protein [Actinotalea sp. K2]
MGGTVRIVSILVPALLVGLGATLAGLVVALARRPEPSPSQAAEAARRHATVVSVIAWLAGVLSPALVLAALSPALASWGGPLSVGVAAGLLPATVGLVFIGVHAVGELTWPRPTGAVRRAPLTPRTMTDVAPRRLRRALLLWSGLLVLALLVFGVMADEGRRVSRTFPEGSSGASPFPGWFYGVPLLVGVAVVLLATVGVLRLIAARPAVMDAAPEWDLGLRRLSAHRVLRGAQLVVGLTLAGVLVVAGQAIRSIGSAVGSVGAVPLGASPAYTTGGTVVAVLAVLVAGACVALAATPGRAPQTPSDQAAPRPTSDADRPA